MCSGREFQVWAAATGKARLPTVASLTGGTTPAERRALGPGTSTLEVSGPRYRGALPWRTVCQHMLLYIEISAHFGIGSVKIRLPNVDIALLTDMVKRTA